MFSASVRPYVRQPGKCKRKVAFPLVPLLLLGLPLVEIAVFVLVGSHIGVLPTIGLVIATSVLGGFLLRVQGLGAMARISAAMERGDAPGRDLVHGLMIMVAGMLLLVPGFVTDAVGLLLFIPPVRDLGWRLIRNRIVIVGAGGQRNPQGAPWRRSRGRTIDLDEDEFRREGGDPDDDGSPPSIPHDR